jgi:hypothetical protein
MVTMCDNDIRAVSQYVKSVRKFAFEISTYLKLQQCWFIRAMFHRKCLETSMLVATYQNAVFRNPEDYNINWMT